MTHTYTQTDYLAFLTFKAIRALQIDVPILKVEEAGPNIRLHLYGGRVLEFPTHNQPEDPKEAGPGLPARRSTAQGKKISTSKQAA